ncbi:hypothetical protein A2U01_0077889, partial [Trifolium medium]|nr:hypothetical protein [Trifolium medium]
AMDNFVKDGSSIAPYSDMVAPNVSPYGDFLALHHGSPYLPPFRVENGTIPPSPQNDKG